MRSSWRSLFDGALLPQTAVASCARLAGSSNSRFAAKQRMTVKSCCGGLIRPGQQWQPPRSS